MRDISRRDFLNGVALTIAVGLTPWDQIRAQPARYPPALMGMRGHHPGSFEAVRDLVACRLATAQLCDRSGSSSW